MYYFAYGSDLNHKEMAQRCPHNKPKFAAKLPHYKLIFAGWFRKWQGPVASIKPVREERVMGAVYEISERDLQLLDRYEGYPVSCDRINVFVVPNDGEPLYAVTYVLKDKEENKPSDKYLAVVRQGYKEWRIV